LIVLRLSCTLKVTLMNNNFSPSTPRSGTSSNYGYVMVVAGFVILLLNVGMLVAIGVFFKPILNEFGWTRAITSGPISLSYLVSGIVYIFSGILADRFGPRKVITAHVIIMGVGFMLMSQVSSVWEIYLFYGVLIGSGAAASVPIFAVVPRWFESKRTAMVGIVSAGGGAGGLIMPFIATWLLTFINWHQAYLVLGVIYIVIALIAAQFFKRSPAEIEAQANRKSKDVAAKSSGSFNSVLTSLKFWLVVAIAFAFGYLVNTIQIHMVNHATDINISANSAAALLAIINGASLVGSIVLGSMGDKFGNKKLFVYTFAALAACFLFILVAKDLWMLYTFTVVFGLAFGSGLANIPALVAQVYGIKSLGLILGITYLAYCLGGSLGGLLAGYIFDIRDSYNLSFIICAVMAVIAVLVTLALKTPSTSGKSKTP
jgi:MFS family permease